MTAVGLAMLWGAVLGGGVWLSASQATTWRAARLADRVAPHVARISPQAFAHAVERARARGGYRGLVARAVAVVPLPVERLTTRLRATGSAMTATQFREDVVARAILGGVVGAAVGGVAVATGSPWQALVALAALGSAAVAYFAHSRLAHLARRVHRDIDAELPIVLGFVAIAVDAGDPLTRALARVARTGRGRLCAELQRAMTESELGRPLEATLEAAAERMAHPVATRALAALTAAVSSGAPVARALRDEVDALEAQRARHLIERASKQEVGMLVPLVFMILPVTILFAVFPGLLVLDQGW